MLCMKSSGEFQVSLSLYIRVVLGPNYTGGVVFQIDSSLPE